MQGATMEPSTEVPQQSSEPAVEDIAADSFIRLLPRFNQMSADISNAKLRRVFVALMEYPFNEKDFVFKSSSEKNLFEIGRTIVDCRQVLIKAAIDLHEKQQAEALGEKK